MIARQGCIFRKSSAWCCQLASPSRYGLTDEELWREAARLVESGWSLDEVRAVLEIPERAR